MDALRHVVVRYEDYDLNYGSTLCDKIMRFVFEGNTEDYAAAIAQVGITTYTFLPNYPYLPTCQPTYTPAHISRYSK